MHLRVILPRGHCAVVESVTHSQDQAFNAYQNAQGQLSPQEFQAAAEQLYAQLSPQQRAELAQQFQQGFQQQGSPLAQQWGNVNPQSITPQQLAQMHQQAQQNHPDLIQKIFSPGGPLSSTTAKIAVAGIAAFAAKKVLSNKK